MCTVLRGDRLPPEFPRRKLLSDQLDRFDAMLDGLADGLNEAIADAAREGARLAVLDAVAAIFSNPDLRAAVDRDSVMAKSR